MFGLEINTLKIIGIIKDKRLATVDKETLIFCVLQAIKLKPNRKEMAKPIGNRKYVFGTKDSSFTKISKPEKAIPVTTHTT
jgi:hypothetical protein